MKFSVYLDISLFVFQSRNSDAPSNHTLIPTSKKIKLTKKKFYKIFDVNVFFRESLKFDLNMTLCKNWRHVVIKYGEINTNINNKNCCHISHKICHIKHTHNEYQNFGIFPHKTIFIVLHIQDWRKGNPQVSIRRFSLRFMSKDLERPGASAVCRAVGNKLEEQ